MQTPIQVTFRDCDHSDAVEADILAKAEKLESFYGRATSCNVTVRAPHHHHHKGRLFHVTIELAMPGIGTVVSHDSGKNHAHEDVYVAVRDSFAAIQRQVKELADKRRSEERQAPKVEIG